jgi:hypothetical protein
MRRLLLVVSGLVSIGLLSVAGCAPFVGETNPETVEAIGIRPGVTPENFRRIRLGMPLEEVNGIFRKLPQAVVTLSVCLPVEITWVEDTFAVSLSVDMDKEGSPVVGGVASTWDKYGNRRDIYLPGQSAVFDHLRSILANWIHADNVRDYEKVTDAEMVLLFNGAGGISLPSDLSYQSQAFRLANITPELLLLPPRPGAGITHENFKRIQDGMTLNEVECILGGPEGSYTNRRDVEWFSVDCNSLVDEKMWYGDEVIIKVYFPSKSLAFSTGKSEGTAVGKDIMFLPLEPSRDRLKRLFPWLTSPPSTVAQK